ncbi:MAG: carboxypeptidase regulatory-like domain-containing protein [Blastocatellales bacterium]
MKRAINVLVAGCLLGTFAITPDSFSSSGNSSGADARLGGAPGVVEAAPALATVTGSVKDERGAPLVGAIVAVLEPRPRGKEIKSVKTDKQGKFSAGVTPGTYLLRAAADGFISKLSSRLIINRPARISYDFALKSTDTLVQKRGDSDDYRWIARSVPRHAMNLREDGEEDTAGQTTNDIAQNSLVAKQASFHGMMQFVAATSSAPAGLPAPDFFGANFAVSASLGGNFEMAFIGQRGVGQLGAQRLAAIASMRPGANHQVTATIGYGQVGLIRKYHREADAFGDPADSPIGSMAARPRLRPTVPVNTTPTPTSAEATPLEQISVSATGEWQVIQPLLVIYGFDYSRFVGSVNQRDSVLPRFAVQYSPSSRLRMNAAVTPGSDQRFNSLESFNSENIQAAFESAPAEIAYSDSPIPDRSQRFEVGIERLFGEGGNTSIEAAAFYDLVSGHGVGVLALPLEVSPETHVTFQQVAHQVAAMNGAARGVRVTLNRRFNDYVTASAGYSFGRGSRFNNAPIDSITPAQLFRGGFFQVATAKLDLDFTERTGTRISTVIRLSPSAVVFAIDPFAGRMSVYDPNINIYVTQELPNFGLPVRWEALVDVRNLMDQVSGVEDSAVQLVTTRTRRTVRGGVAFRW